MAYWAIFKKIFDIVKKLKAEIIASDVAGIDPAVVRCVEKFFNNNVNTVKMDAAFLIDGKNKLFGQKKHSGYNWYGNAGGESAKVYAQALQKCGAHPLIIHLSNLEWYNFFGDEYRARFERQDIANIRAQLEAAANRTSNRTSRGTSDGISPAVLIGGALAAYLILRGSSEK